MKKIAFPIVFVLLIVVYGCKKKDPAPTPVAGTTGGSTSSGSVPAGLAPTLGNDYCNLQTMYQYLDGGGVVLKDSAIYVSFYSGPSSSVVPTSVYAGTVSLNGVDFQSNGNYYYLDSAVNITGSLSWSVTGSGTVTAFSKRFTPIYPGYTGGHLLPDTCVKANGITITVSGVTNCRSGITVSIFTGSNNLVKYIYGSNGSVSFSASELAQLQTNQSIAIELFFGNYYTATVGGINRGFSNTIQYLKSSYLK